MFAGYVLSFANLYVYKFVKMLYISAWASALLVLTKLGNAKALMRGTSNRYRSPRFFGEYR